MRMDSLSAWNRFTQKLNCRLTQDVVNLSQFIGF